MAPTLPTIEAANQDACKVSAPQLILIHVMVDIARTIHTIVYAYRCN